MNIQSEKLKTYRCSFCNKEIFKGFVSSLALTCPHCNKFVRIPEKIQDPLVGSSDQRHITQEILCFHKIRRINYDD